MEHRGFTSLIVISLCVLLVIKPKPSDSGEVPQPFRVVWNYPDAICRSLHIDFELDKFHIEHNEHSFVEDTIAIFYSGQSGKWPYIDFRDHNKYVHGGLPKDIDMPAHLAAWKEAIESALKPEASGFGVIDMENWRPVLHTNYGRYTPYKTIYANLIEEENPDLGRQGRRRLGKAKWLNESLAVMIGSLEAAKESRPHEHWGYYGYPQLVTKNQNGLLAPLWQVTTAYYPSIYIKTFDEPKDEARGDIKREIAETFRVRAEYGNPSDPIMAYTVAQYKQLGPFHGDWLQMEIRLPLEMGVDGIILWASSQDFDPPTEKCTQENEFVHTTLGPLIEGELERMAKCSQELCAARGRCVKKEYSDAIPYLLSRGVSDEVIATAAPSGADSMDLESVDEEFRSDFACQCYDGASGDRCTDAYDV